jgi:hypothetical protein
MSPSGKGGGGTPLRDVPGSEASGGASEPIGSLAEYQLSTPSFKQGGTQQWEDWQSHLVCLASPKKRKANKDIETSTPEQALTRTIEDAVAKALRDFTAPSTATKSVDDVQSLRDEMKESINRVHTQLTQLVSTIMARVQAEADNRADAMLQKLVYMLNNASRKGDSGLAPSLRAQGT